MKQIRLILVIALGTIFSLSASALPVVTETFQDYQTGRLGDPNTGGTGLIPGGWHTPQNSINVTNDSGSLDGTSLGLVESSGDRAFIASTANTNDNYGLNSGNADGAYMIFANKNTPEPAFPATNQANVYCSFLYQVNDITNFYTNGVSTIAVMHRQNSGVYSSPDANFWRMYLRSNSVNTVQVGFAKNPYGPTPCVTNWAATALPVGQPFFVVVELQIIATNSVSYYTNDVISMWVNPAPQYFGTNEANVPTPDAISPATDGAADSSPTGPGRFFITDNGPSAEFDEMRIGTNWADVTPWYGQCLPAGFTEQPANVTQTAGIGATFSSKSSASTSPTRQWQLSKDNGTTWSNIVGATLSQYTTPNLQTADSGNQYRVIVTTPCDGSSATSQVATVTVTPESFTSSGVILDDTFPTPPPYRDVGPVTSTHSTWFTATADTANFYTDPSGGGLIAIPDAGSSTLYLGYYVAETALSKVPLSLAVGTQLNVTFKFTTGSFSSFTNNGSLRIGLFDYADSGTLFNADDANLTGSTGNGLNVRGYMLSLDFGTNFSENLPLSLLVRSALGDNNLMGTTGDYLSMLSGPVGNGPGGVIGDGPATGSWSNAPAYQPGTTYTLALTVARTQTNTCLVGATLTGGSLNLSYAAIDTNGFAYHRFDTIAVRPNKLENAPDQFAFRELKVQVTNIPVQVSSIAIKKFQNVLANGTNTVTLTWQATPSDADTGFGFTVGYKNSLTNANWTRLRSNILTTNYTGGIPTSTNIAGFFRVTYP